MEQIPILKMGPFLLVSIQVDMHDRLAMQLQDDLTNRIVADRAKGVLIDISSLDVVDSFIGRMISDISKMGRVLDAHSRGRNAAGRCHHAGRARIVARGRTHGFGHRARHGSSANGARGPMNAVPPCPAPSHERGATGAAKAAQAK